MSPYIGPNKHIFFHSFLTCNVFLFIHHLEGGDDLSHNDEQVTGNQAVAALGLSRRLVQGISHSYHHETDDHTDWNRGRKLILLLFTFVVGSVTEPSTAGFDSRTAKNNCMVYKYLFRVWLFMCTYYYCESS